MRMPMPVKRISIWLDLPAACGVALPPLAGERAGGDEREVLRRFTADGLAYAMHATAIAHQIKDALIPARHAMSAAHVRPRREIGIDGHAG